MTETVVYDTDTSDMYIPHGLFRTAFSTAGDTVRSVPDGDAGRVALVGSYFDNVLRFLDAHHGGEDVIVWPVLTARCPQAAELIARMEADHEAVHRLRGSAGDALEQWTASADAAAGLLFAAAFAALGATLEEHLGAEEVEILPLASRNISPEEWGALPGHAMGHFTGDKIWLILGLVFEQMTDEQRARTLTLLPPPAVEMWTGFGSAAFDEFIGGVRATA